MSNIFEGRGVFPRGEENTAYADYFIGTSYLEMLSTKGVFIGNVTFDRAVATSGTSTTKGGRSSW